MKLNFDHNGLAILAADYQGKAIELLAKYGIKFERALANTVERQTHSGIFRGTGDCDVAYWHRVMHTLVIHDKPRKWGKQMLDNLTGC
jgi:hypothetical protein